jgi:hypothetical protein
MKLVSIKFCTREKTSWRYPMSLRLLAAAIEG